MSTGVSRFDDGVVEVEFSTTSPAYPFVDVARSQDCQVVLEKQLPRGDGLQAEYFSVVGAEPEHIAEALEDHAHEAVRILVDDEDRSLVEFIADSGCPARFLAVRGALPTDVEGTPAGGTIVAEVLPQDDPAEIVAAFQREHDVEFVAKRQKPAPTPLLGETELRDAILDQLTDRQREVLETAFEAGYYERPRRASGEEVAQRLGISPTTFQEHLRTAERKLVTFLIEDRSVDRPQ